MSNATLGAQVFALLLALLQCGLALVMAYRLFLLSRVYKSVDPHRRPTTMRMLKVLRVSIFIMTTLQCARCIDPFCALAIWPYELTRSIQFAVTVSIYVQYSATTYVCMDTLYACALKRTPGWLAVIVSILPILTFLIGFSGLIGEFVVAKQYMMAIVYFYVVISLAINLTTYNVSGIWLIRILRIHQRTGAAGEELSSSKSACKFELVVAKTMRSMFLLTLPSLAAIVVYSVSGITNSNTRDIAPYNPENLNWNVYVTIFAQLTLGLLFTRTAWISKTALDAEIMLKSTTTLSTGTSRLDMKERGSRMSQSPKVPSRNSQPEPEVPVVAVTVVDDSRSDSISDGPVAEMCVLPTAEIV